MDILFPILIAAVVALGAWGATQFFVNTDRKDKRRLKQRLSSDVAASGQSNPAASITISAAELEVLTGRSSSGKKSFMSGLRGKLATISPGTSLRKFLVTCAGIGLGLFLIIFLVSANLLAAAVAGAIAAYVPIFLLSGKCNKRQTSFAMQLPEALDFLARILRAGHSLSTGLQMMGTELPEPLAGEFRKTYDQHTLGQPLEDCLRDMTIRVQGTDFSFFVTAVLIQRQTGGDLSMVLNNISGMIRGRIRLQQYVKAKTAEGRFTGYILVAFPGLMFVITDIMNPAYGGTLLHTSTGLWLMGISVALQLLGLFFIRMLTKVKV